MGRVSVRLALAALGAALFALAPLTASAAETSAAVIDSIRARLDRHGLVRAEFVQTRQMAALKRPLVISGRVLVSPRDGVLWAIEQPYRITYAFRQDAIVEFAADGTRTVRTARDVPGLAQVGRVFRALVTADASALGEHFEASAREQGARWELLLKPRQAQVAQYLKGLSVAGGDFVDSVRLDEAGGDTTRIQFRNSRAGGVLSAEERRLLTDE